MLLGADETTYTVQKGDTLYRISLKYDIPVDVLMEYNKITNVQSVRVGTKIIIPSMSRYTVKKGDTFYSIARHYDIDVNDLMSANNIKDAASLRTGQTIVIPGGKAADSGNDSKAAAGTTGTTASFDPKNRLSWPHPGARESYNGKMQGILIEGTRGDLVYSSSSGRVIWANPYRGYGNVVLVQSEDGYVYGYLGNNDLVVTVGEEVETGSAIGRMGTWFHETKSSLLFIVWHAAKRTYMDPAAILSSRN